MNLPQIEVQWPVSIVSIVLATRKGAWSGMEHGKAASPTCSSGVRSIAQYESDNLLRGHLARLQRHTARSNAIQIEADDVVPCQFLSKKAVPPSIVRPTNRHAETPAFVSAFAIPLRQALESRIEFRMVHSTSPPIGLRPANAIAAPGDWGHRVSLTLRPQRNPASLALAKSGST